jgi:hypothetical protein
MGVRSMNEQNYDKERTCPVCGKEFYPGFCYQWGWRIGNESNPQLVCSYKCQRKWETSPERNKKPRQKRERIPVKIIETGEIFGSLSECASWLNTTATVIHNKIKNKKDFNGLHFERVVG